ncbi:pseudouridine synthase, partial [Blyttiomyces helicus]
MNALTARVVCTARLSAALLAPARAALVVPAREKHSASGKRPSGKRRSPKQTGTKHTGRPTILDPRLGGYNPPISMSRSTAERWSKVAPYKKGAAPPPVKGRAAPQPEPQVETIVRKFFVDDHQHLITMEAFVAFALKCSQGIARLKVLNGEVGVTGSAHARYVDIKPKSTLNAGDYVQVVLAKPPSKEVIAERQAKKAVDYTETLRKSILYRDKDIIIINKPANLAVHAGTKNSLNLESLLPALTKPEDGPLRLVHRLDVGTTGALILARSKEAAERVSDLLKPSDVEGAGALQKTYLAIVSPALPKPAPDAPAAAMTNIVTGIVQIGEAPKEEMKTIEWHDDYTLSSTGKKIKKAVTAYRVLASANLGSLIELSPTTGRKHQLRVHCAQTLQNETYLSLGALLAPIIGDFKYGPGCPSKIK